MEVSEFIYSKINSGKCIEVFLDLARAFDTLQHDVLLSKLNVVGMKGIASDLIKSFLRERRQGEKITTQEMITKSQHVVFLVEHCWYHYSP